LKIGDWVVAPIFFEKWGFSSIFPYIKSPHYEIFNPELFIQTNDKHILYKFGNTHKNNAHTVKPDGHPS
jgi:hypothetical protein